MQFSLKKYSLAGLLLLLCNVVVWSQDAFEWADFRQQVLAWHPLAQRANLYRDQASAGLLRAQGGFDLKTYSDYSGKNFDQKTYFQYLEAGVKLPTWLGLEIKSSYNWADGVFLNSSDKLPAAGQASFGFNWTLGQGLLIDQRRADLFEARLGLQMGDAERRAALNELLYEGAKVYWTWALTDNQLRVFEDALQQAQLRHVALRESFVHGERSGMDTTETFIQVQNRLLDVNFARLERQNAALALGNFVWNAEGQANPPAPATTAPVLAVQKSNPRLDASQISELSGQALAQHPDIQAYTVKLQTLDVERRWKNEKRKPVLDVSYNLLGAGWQFFPTANVEGGGAAVLARDIKWGLNFSYPIPNRKARGDLQVTQVKVAQTQLSLRQKRLEVDNKVRQYANELNTLAGQLTLYRDITANYRTLLDGEIERFRQGESSVFLVNTREQRWLDAQIKFLKLVSEYRKAEAGLRWATGDF